MKILYWNVNGLRAVERKNCLQPLISELSPDIVGIQEIKAKPEQLNHLEINYPEYLVNWHSAIQPGYSGTGLLIKKNFLENNDFSIIKIEKGINSSQAFIDDTEGRCQTLFLSNSNTKLAILNIYFPNGGKSEAAWYGKLEFYREVLKYVNKLRSESFLVIWGGDVNCAHHEIDLALPKENEGQIGFHPQERQWLSNWIMQGWCDIFRSLYPKKIIYSWWHLVTRARERNIGWRIDYAFCDQKLLKKVESIDYLTNIYGSDHCPLFLSIDIS